MHMPTLLLIGVALIGVVVALQALFQKRLRERHPEEWKALTRPIPPGSSDGHPQGRLSTYLTFRQYSAVSDPVLTIMGDAILIACVLLGILFFYWTFYGTTGGSGGPLI
jgi:uncharacterized membrane protein YqiK